jgi:hypothetical protein
MYGPHVNVARTTVNEGNLHDSLTIFDEKIHEALKYSTHCLLSTSEKV